MAERRTRRVRRSTAIRRQTPEAATFADHDRNTPLLTSTTRWHGKLKNASRELISLMRRLLRLPGQTAATGEASTDRVSLPVRVLRMVLPALTVVITALVVTLLYASRPTVGRQPLPELTIPVEVVKAQITTHRPTLKLYGQVVPGRSVELRTQVAGDIISIDPNLRQGGYVKSGQLLFVIDPFSYELAANEARQQLSEARARLEELNATVEGERNRVVLLEEQLTIEELSVARATQLALSQSTSQATVDERRIRVIERKQAILSSKNTIALTEARIQQQKANIARLMLGVERAEHDLANTRVVAPFSGHVKDVTAELGRVANQNDRLVTIVDFASLEVRFSVPNSQFGRVLQGDGTALGRDIVVSWDIGDTPLAFQATTARLGAEVIAGSGGIDVFAKFRDLPPDAPLRSGAFVQVDFPDRLYDSVARLPTTAVYGDHIYVVGNEGRLDGRSVTVVADDADYVLVRGDLKDGENVLMTRVTGVADGLRVHVQ